MFLERLNVPPFTFSLTLTVAFAVRRRRPMTLTSSPDFTLKDLAVDGERVTVESVRRVGCWGVVIVVVKRGVGEFVAVPPRGKRERVVPKGRWECVRARVVRRRRRGRFMVTVRVLVRVLDDDELVTGEDGGLVAVLGSGCFE